MQKSNYIPALIVSALLSAACASIGRPDGGPRDTEPPVFVRSVPSPGATNVTSQKISIYFNENIQLSDPGTKISISPAQTQQPSISANGRHISIELKDSLKPNTTYTIDFSDAINDLNEGNALDGFALSFSTGSLVDSLAISGMVLQADNLEPAQNLLVGVYQTGADTAITTLPFDRITRTNQYGQFTVRNLAPGAYQLFAVNDVNRDLHWDRSEDIAFYDEIITPTISTIHQIDTLKTSEGTDSLVARTYFEKLPNDILLSWFNENYKPQYLKNYNRTNRRVISLEMNCPVDSLPILRVIARGSTPVNKKIEEISLLSRSTKGDTLQYWLTDSIYFNSDSLLIETKYRRVDSLDNIVWKTDSLKFNMKGIKGKKESKVKVLSLQEKIDSIRAISDTIPIDTFMLMQPTVFLNISASSTTQDINKPFIFNTERPYKSIDFSAMHLLMMPDSVWIPVEGHQTPEPADSTWLKSLKLEHRWIPGMKYRLHVDSMAVVDPYGAYNRTIELDFNVRQTEDYSNVIFNLSGLPEAEDAYVQIINSNDSPVVTAPVNSGQAILNFLLPGTYYARLFIDSDKNAEYTSGSLTERRQPEDVYYFNKKLNLKKNWDRTENWDIQAIPVDMQKPDEIKKNKPKPKPGEEDSESHDDEEEEDEFVSNFGRNKTKR